MGTVFRKNFELGRIRLKEDHVGKGTRSSWEFRSTLYSSFAFFCTACLLNLAHSGVAGLKDP